MDNQKTYYITTPIYYPSDKLHIGHSYCTVCTDAMARYKRLRGYDVKFLTGTDEHGQKIERIAKMKGITPKEYVDHIVSGIQDLWAKMDISYDQFIRTTDDIHVKAVQKIFKALYDKGDIYKGSYEGLYCTPCETFFTEHQLQDGKCPDCGRDVEKIQEEAYFFRLSKYQEPLINYIEAHPEFIQPPSRQNEMLSNFLRPGLEDLCVSRTSFQWGVPVDFDPKHVVYVWVDALSNYITALGYGSDADEEYQKYWPADLHVVGKEIVRFHTIIWPAMLMALDLPLPKQVFGHGWLVIDGGKMSKSKGNVVDPTLLVDKYGVDAIRYFLLREIAFGQDGNFTNEALIQRMNADLANDLGNLVSRTVGMIEKYFSGKLPEKHASTAFDTDLEQLAQTVAGKVEAYMDQMLFSDALTEIWSLVRRTNKYIDETSPWVLAKEEAKQAELAGALYHVAESTRVISILIQPFMPNTPKKIWEQLSIDNDQQWESAKVWGALPKAVTVQKGEVLFPRIDMKKDLEELQEAMKQAQAASVANQEEYITIDDFDKLKLRVGLVQACEAVKGSKKLLKSQIKIGTETRQILSGIAKFYSPEEMVGKRVIVLTNLPPRKMMGELSCGMVLAAEDAQGNLSLVTPDKADWEDGSEVG